MSNDRNKAEYDRLHHQELRITGAEPSLYHKSGWCLKYVKEQCAEATRLSSGPSIVYRHTGVSKQDMFKAQEFLDDAQSALDDPTAHPKLGYAWASEHKSEAYRIIKETRAGLRFAREEVEKMHIVSIEDLLKQAWGLYNSLRYDSRESPTKPRDVFAKLKETQALIGESYLQKSNRDELRDKVDELWKLVQGFITESQRQYEERQKARAIRDANRAQNQREWRERQEGHIERWRSRIHNIREFIERLQGQISDDQEKLAGARTFEFAQRVQGWISEKVKKIAQVQTEINGLLSQIDDVQSKLNNSRD